MSENKKSFWSSIPGLVTGLAGLVTGIVGLVTVLIQLDVIGGDDSGGATAVGTSPASSAPAGGGTGGTTPTPETPALTVPAATVEFKPTDPPEKNVTVKNDSRAASLTVAPPRVEGPDRNQFSATLGTCSGPVPAGGTCTLKVTFTPAGPLRTYSATLEVGAPGARADTVDLKATTVL
jgi:hypothetical protein